MLEALRIHQRKGKKVVMASCGVQQCGAQQCGVQICRVQICGVQNRGVQNCEVQNCGVQNCRVQNFGVQSCGVLYHLWSVTVPPAVLQGCVSASPSLLSLRAALVSLLPPSSPAAVQAAVPAAPAGHHVLPGCCLSGVQPQTLTLQQ